MSETILLKDVEGIYVQWMFGDFKLFDGNLEVSAVGKRNDKDGVTYLVHYVGEEKDWRFGIATDELRLERRELAPAQPATADAGERVRSLPQRYRDERMAARERGEAIKDYTAWLESQVMSAEFDRSVLRNLNDENRKHMLFMNDEIDKDFQRIGDLLEMRGKFKRDYGTNKIVEQLADLQAKLAAAEARADAALDAMRTLQNAGLSEVIEHYQHRAYIADIYGDIRETLTVSELTATVNGLQCIKAALQANG